MHEFVRRDKQCNHKLSGSDEVWYSISRFEDFVTDNDCLVAVVESIPIDIDYPHVIITLLIHT